MRSVDLGIPMKDVKQTEMAFIIKMIKGGCWIKYLPMMEKILSCTLDGCWLLFVSTERMDLPDWRYGYDTLAKALQQINREWEFTDGQYPATIVEQAAANFARHLPVIVNQLSSAIDESDNEDEGEAMDEDEDPGFTTPDGAVFTQQMLDMRRGSPSKKSKNL